MSKKQISMVLMFELFFGGGEGEVLERLIDRRLGFTRKLKSRH